MDITNNMNPSVIDLLGLMFRAKGVEVCVDHPSFPGGSYTPEAELLFKPYDSCVPVSALTFNETSANVSLMTIRQGFVRISPEWKGVPRGVPETVTTRVVRNYTIIRDGSLAITHLPLRVSSDVAMLLETMGFNLERKDGLVIVDLAKLPSIHFNTKAPSVEEFAQKHYQLLEVQAFCKVFKHFAGETDRRTAFEHVYGEAAADWLAERGVTVNGFSPPGRKHTRYKPTLTLECKVKGAADLPSVEEAQERRDAWRADPKKKLSLGVSLMHPALNLIDAFRMSSTYLNPVDRLMMDFGEASNAAMRKHAQDTLFATWARLNYEAADQERRRLLREIGQMTFVVLSRFREGGWTFCDDVYIQPNGIGFNVPVKSDLKDVCATIKLKKA